MGLKIHRMLREDTKDPQEIAEEAKRRKEMSDSILEIIYHRILKKKGRKGEELTDEELE
jgi:hypothetical protein